MFLYTCIRNDIRENRKRKRSQAAKSRAPIFNEGDIFFVQARILALTKMFRSVDERKAFKACVEFTKIIMFTRLKACIKGAVEDMYVANHKFFHNRSLVTNTIVSHVLSSETGHEVQCLMPLFKLAEVLIVQSGLQDLSNLKTM